MPASLDKPYLPRHRSDVRPVDPLRDPASQARHAHISGGPCPACSSFDYAAMAKHREGHLYQPFGEAFAAETGVNPLECAECGLVPVTLKHRLDPVPWADAWGRWRVRVPRSGDASHDHRLAHRLIAQALEDRGEMWPGLRVDLYCHDGDISVYREA